MSGQSLKFDKRQTLKVKGVAICLLLFHHLFYASSRLDAGGVSFPVVSRETIMAIASGCRVCVWMFVFLSSYGLAKRYEQMIARVSGAQPGEVFIVLSYSGETSGAIRIAKRAKETGNPVIAFTSFGRNTLSQLADVTLHVSTREKLVEKLGCYGMNISTMLLLDVIYSCVLALDYDRNVINRVKVTRSYEIYRDSDNPILHDRRE